MQRGGKLRYQQIKAEAPERAALTELLTQRRTGRFISAEEMDHRLEEMLKAKLISTASRKD
jgi:hypothetical protein